MVRLTRDIAKIMKENESGPPPLVRSWRAVVRVFDRVTSPLERPERWIKKMLRGPVPDNKMLGD